MCNRVGSKSTGLGPAHHEADRGAADRYLAAWYACFEVLAEVAVAREPYEEPFSILALGQRDEPELMLELVDDLRSKPEYVGSPVTESNLVGVVCPDRLEPGGRGLPVKVGQGIVASSGSRMLASRTGRAWNTPRGSTQPRRSRPVMFLPPS